MIQDIAPHEYHNEYRPRKPKEEDYLMCYDGRKLLVNFEGEQIHFPKFKAVEEVDGVHKEDLYGNYIYLFEIDGVGYFLCRQVEALQEEAIVEKSSLHGFEWKDIRSIREQQPKYLSFAGVTAWQLYQWYESRKFCGKCGSPMEQDQHERMMRCPKCGQMEFPKICPAVIVGVTHGDKILMSKYNGRSYTRYALLAGFTEIGETLEETVAREVMEEVGLKVKNITYYKCQPWSFSDTLLVGYYCELEGEETITLDQEELSMAGWFDRKEITVEDEDCSLTNEMIIKFKDGTINQEFFRENP